MSRVFAVVLALLALPALAQEGLGLDLSEEAKPEQQKPEGEQPSAETQSPPPPAAEPPPPAGASALDEDRDVTQDDRVKSVQRKVYLKRGRFEVAPAFAFSINDPFYTKVGPSLRVGYFLAETLALAGRGALWRTFTNEEARTARFAFESQVRPSRPVWSALADVEWSPFYGKVAFLNDILHFDAYLLGGAGVVFTETSAEGARSPGLRPAVDLGVGARFVARDFLAVNVGVVNTGYVDQPQGTLKNATQNLMTLNVGVSVFFPFTSTGRDAE